LWGSKEEFVRFDKYRQIFSYEFNPQFLKPKNCEYDKKFTEEEKKGKQNFIHITKKNF